jgi:hypothetical protein
MIKKLLMFCTVFMAGTAIMTAQFANIGLIGGSTVTGWNADTDMATTDGITYTLNNVAITVPATDSGVKFRQDDAWTINWGSAGFPSGIGTQGGANIPATNGVWNITFNKNTGAYNFVPAGVVYDVVNITGNSSLELSTSDGITYVANNALLETGNFSFVVNNETVGRGSAAFPTGTAVAGGMIPVTGNSYNITFNKNTGAYSFSYVRISLIGAGVVNWDTDTELATTDGINYTLTNFTFAGGEAKFRLNNAWAISWGGTNFPSGTVTTSDSPNFVITAGTYNVTFNRITGAFAFTAPTADIATFTAATATVYPNPSQNVWNFSAGTSTINAVQVTDVTGKVIFSKNNTAATSMVDASTFAAGVYFARVTTGNTTQTLRVVKN